MINFVALVLIEIALTLWVGLIIYFKLKQSQEKFKEKIAELERLLEQTRHNDNSNFY